MEKRWLKELARDLIALGGIPFLIIVIVRTSLLDKWYYPMQFVVGALIFFLLMFLFRANLYSGIGLIILVFTSLYYGDLQFTIPAIFFYLVLIGALFYLKEKRSMIIKGILFGIISSLISYYLVNLFFRI